MELSLPKNRYDILNRLRAFLSDSDGKAGIVEDQRRDKRHSVLLHATVYPIETYGDAVVHELSDEGLIGESAINLAVGQVAHLTLLESTLTGTVLWTRGSRFRLSHTDTGETWPIFSELDQGYPEDESSRACRANMSAVLLAGQPPERVLVRNVSRRGMLLDGAKGLERGQHLLVNIGTRGIVSGTVRWRHASGKVGIETEEPIGIFPLLYADE